MGGGGKRVGGRGSEEGKDNEREGGIGRMKQGRRDGSET